MLDELKLIYKDLMIHWPDIKIKGIEYCDNCLCTEAETGNIAIFCDLCQGVIINN